jgi:glutamine synthetase
MQKKGQDKSVSHEKNHLIDLTYRYYTKFMELE